MTSRRSGPIKISQKKAEELSNLFRGVNEELIGSHLSEDQFVGYVTGELSEGEMLAIDRHLEVCEDCGEQIEHLATNAMAWSGSAGEQPIQELRQKALTDFDKPIAGAVSLLQELALQIRSLFLGTNLTPGMVQAATEEKKPSQQGEQWSCYLDMDRRGNYILRISSHDLSLEGTQLRLFSRNWQRDIMLLRVNENQVGAKVVLSPEDLANIPREHDFSVELVREGPEAD
jgi:hypothetical protein